MREDDTFTTPYLCRPFDHGADIVCHSLTKWMGGHGTGIGGIVIDAGTFKWGAGKHPLYSEPDTSYGGLRWGLDLPAPLLPLAFILRMRTVPLRNLGAAIAPDNAWMFLQGIETLPLRMEKHCSNALEVAKFLKAHPDKRRDAAELEQLDREDDIGNETKFRLGLEAGFIVTWSRRDHIALPTPRPRVRPLRAGR